MGIAMTVKLALAESMSPSERAREACAILAAVVERLHANPPRASDVSLGFSAPQRVHTTPSPPGVQR